MERSKYIDIAKGITICLMVIGHTGIPVLLSNFIFAFHMPLFFIASGWTTNWDKYSTCTFIYRRFKTLIIPFLIYSLIVQALKYSIGNGDIVSWLIHGWGGYALWFIPVLYLSSVLVKVLYTINSRFIILGGAIMAAVGGCLKYYTISLPWNLSSVPYASFLIIIGSFLFRYNKYIEKPNWWFVIITFLITGLISYNWRLDIAWNSILPIVPLTIGALSGTMMMFTASVYIDRERNLFDSSIFSNCDYDIRFLYDLELYHTIHNSYNCINMFKDCQGYV